MDPLKHEVSGGIDISALRGRFISSCIHHYGDSFCISCSTVPRISRILS